MICLYIYIYIYMDAVLVFYLYILVQKVDVRLVYKIFNFTNVCLLKELFTGKQEEFFLPDKIFHCLSNISVGKRAWSLKLYVFLILANTSLQATCQNSYQFLKSLLTKLPPTTINGFRLAEMICQHQTLN